MDGFLNPEEVLKELNLSEEMTAADFGSGSGGWAIPLAKILKNGLVYAIDVLEAPLSVLQGRANLEKVPNIKIVKANIEKEKGSGLAENSVDLVLLTNLLFQTDEKKIVLEEAKRILKPSGKILVVDWKDKEFLGPDHNHKIDPEMVKKITETLGLNFEKEIPAGKYHFGLIFRK